MQNTQGTIVSSNMSTVRTTISLEDKELEELQSIAKKQDRSLSSLLVTSVLGENRPKLPRFDLHSFDTIRRHLEQAAYPDSLLESIGKECLGIAQAISDYPSAENIYANDFRRAVSHDEFFPQLTSYPPNFASETRGFQEDLASAIVELPDFGTLGRLGGDIYANLSDQQSDPKSKELTSHHLVVSGLIGSKPIIYLFPFFRPAHRRPLWGVVDYGRHTHIGLLLHKETFGLSLGPALIKEMESKPEHFAFAWLGQKIIDPLCARATNKDGRNRIGFRGGFFEDEITQVLWSKAQSNSRYAFERFRFPYAPEAFEAELAQTRCAAIVIDLQEQVKKTNNNQPVWDENKWVLVKFPHHANVPVGVGFTLSLLPRLLIHDNWKEIRKRALYHIKEHSLAESMFATSGIKINDK